MRERKTSIGKAILFDLGKVLLDFDKDVILNRFRQKTDLSDQEINKGLALYHQLGFEIGLISPQEFHERLMAELGLKMPFEEFHEIWCDIFRVITPMVELFHRLREKHRTYILSNTDPLHLPYVLEKFPWLNMFDGRAISYELGVRKPNREFFIKALEKFAENPSGCVYIDDLEENVVAAQDLGIDGILHISSEDTLTKLKGFGIDVGE